MDLKNLQVYWVSPNNRVDKIQGSATSGGSSNCQFGTERDSFKVINSWRNSLSFEQADSVQGVCNLDLLRYKVFDSETELRNLKHLRFNFLTSN